MDTHEYKRARNLVLFCFALWLGALLVALLSGCQTIAGLGEDLRAAATWGQERLDRMEEPSYRYGSRD
jgi:predicted small secreted protein